MRNPPWKCRQCGEQKVGPIVKDYSTEIEHDGRAYLLKVPQLETWECANCKNITLSDSSHEMVLAVLRREAGLLSPEEILNARNQLQLTQKQLATALRIAEETVNRWERGRQLQQRAMDLLLRLYFGLPVVRSWLDEYHRPSSVAEVSVKATLVPAETQTNKAPVKKYFNGRYPKSRRLIEGEQLPSTIIVEST